MTRLERAGVVALAALAPVSALAVDPAGWYPFGPAKWLAITVLLLAGSAAVLARRPLVVDRPLVVPGAALLALLALAAAVGEDPLYAWIGTPERHFGVLTWAFCLLALVVGRSLDPRVARSGPVVTGLVLAGLGTGAVATAEALGWEPDVLDVGRRLTGSFGSSAYLGAATALFLPIAIGALVDRTAQADRTRGVGGVAGVGSGVATVLLVVACIGAGARAAWLGLVVAAALTAWARRRALRRWAGAHVRRATVIGVAGASALIALVVLTPAGARLGALGDEGAPGGAGRIDEWRVATRVVRGHPVLGVGPEGYRVAFASAVDADYERAHGRALQPDRAHSGPIDLALAGGLGAVVAWVVLAGAVGRAAWRALRTGPPWLVGVAAALVAHVVGQLLLFPIVELEVVAWLLAGVVVAAAPGAPAERPTRTAPRAAVTGLALLAVGAIVAGATDVVADRRAGDAAGALARGDAAAAATAAADAVDLRPDVLRLHLLAARAAVADRQGTVAGLREVDAALDLSPGDPIALLHRARLLAERALATRVEAHLTTAVEEIDRLLDDDPHNVALWRLAGTLAARSGDEHRAAEAAEVVRALDPPHRPDQPGS